MARGTNKKPKRCSIAHVRTADAGHAFHSRSPDRKVPAYRMAQASGFSWRQVGPERRRVLPRVRERYTLICGTQIVSTNALWLVKSTPSSSVRVIIERRQPVTDSKRLA